MANLVGNHVKMNLAIIGDYNPTNHTHIATNQALEHSASFAGLSPTINWIPTDSIPASMETITATNHAYLISPGSPYKNMQAVLDIIRFARENRIPTLGTCGGFQHMAIEFARNVLGVHEAAHAETDPYASELVVAPLTCILKGAPLQIRITGRQSSAYRIFRTDSIQESYYCNFGLNPHYQQRLNEAGFRITGSDDTHEARILELDNHPFFLATLFVPQTNSRPDNPHPLITAFLSAGNDAASHDAPHL